MKGHINSVGNDYLSLSSHGFLKQLSGNKTMKHNKKIAAGNAYIKIAEHPVKQHPLSNMPKSGAPSLVSLVDDIDEHLGKSLALGAMLTLDNVYSVDKYLMEHYFWQIKDELWHIKQAWQKLNDRIFTEQHTKQ